MMGNVMYKHDQNCVNHVISHAFHVIVGSFLIGVKFRDSSLVREFNLSGPKFSIRWALSWIMLFNQEFV